MGYLSEEEGTSVSSAATTGRSSSLNLPSGVRVSVKNTFIEFAECHHGRESGHDEGSGEGLHGKGAHSCKARLSVPGFGNLEEEDERLTICSGSTRDGTEELRRSVSSPASSPEMGERTPSDFGDAPPPPQPQLVPPQQVPPSSRQGSKDSAARGQHVSRPVTPQLPKGLTVKNTFIDILPQNDSGDSKDVEQSPGARSCFARFYSDAGFGFGLHDDEDESPYMDSNDVVGALQLDDDSIKRSMTEPALRSSLFAASAVADQTKCGSNITGCRDGRTEGQCQDKCNFVPNEAEQASSERADNVYVPLPMGPPLPMPPPMMPWPQWQGTPEFLDSSKFMQFQQEQWQMCHAEQVAPEFLQFWAWPDSSEAMCQPGFWGGPVAAADGHWRGAPLSGA